MEKSKLKIQISDKKAALLLVLVGIQILYSGYTILKSMSAILSLDKSLLGNPAVLFRFGIYAIIIYAAIGFFRGKTYGWYGEACLYIILLLKNILIFVSIITFLLFKVSLFNNIPLPFMMNWNIIQVVIEFILSGLMIMLLFSNDTINGLNIRNSSRTNLIIKVSVVVIITIVLYFAVIFLLSYILKSFFY